MKGHLRIMKIKVDNLGQVESLVPLRSLNSQVILGSDEVYNQATLVIQRKIVV